MSEEGGHQQTETERAAAALLGRMPILENRYFRALTSGEMPRQAFVGSQRQFLFAVGGFSRPLAALAARLPGSRDREVLIHNLAEEHGWDEEHPAAGFRANLAHDRTFGSFLESLGVSGEERRGDEPAAAVRAFNLGLLGACANEPPGFAFCALGVIEYAFADISALIGRRVVELKWVREEELVHYSLHAAIDKRHAAELFEAAERWEKVGEPTPVMLAGLEFGRYLFDRLYEDFSS